MTTLRSNYNARDIYLASVLYDAIEDTNLSAVKSLIAERNANPNVLLPKKGISAFHLAIGNDSTDFALEVTNMILQYGGNPNVRSLDGLTPVHIAAAWGRFDILVLLIHCGGDPYLRDVNYMSPLDYAVEHKKDDIAAYIKENCPYNVPNILLEREEEKVHCDLILDKILLTQGPIVGEYGLKEIRDITVETDLRQRVPYVKNDEYVLNWIGSTMAETKYLNYNNTENNLSPAGSDSDEDSDSCNKKYTNITQKRRFRKDSARVASPLRCLPIEENVMASCTRRRKKKPLVRQIEHSRESGIMTLPESSVNPSQFKSILCIKDGVDDKLGSISDSVSTRKDNKDAGSDYFTCTDISVASNILEKNIFEISSDKSATNNSCGSLITDDRSIILPCDVTSAFDDKNKGFLEEDQTFASVSEIYKYTDAEEGIVLFEKRLLVTPTKNLNETIASCVSSQTSNVSSLPQNFDYDTDTLRKELTSQGFEPGPITKSTKRVYLKKLYKLKKCPQVAPTKIKDVKRVYSRELVRTLKNPEWICDLTTYKELDLIVANQFNSSDPSRRWREGKTKSSFNYLLLDPRITQNLPCRSETLQSKEIWETFLSAVFYVGKGKRSRPYAHLYEAVGLWNQGKFTSKNKKIQHILDIWSSNNGVICLHVFQNVIPVEAYTREAAMISAIGLDNLRNLKVGDFYGQACTWSMSQKRSLGVYLLWRSMNILLQEGERQLSPTDID